MNEASPAPPRLRSIDLLRGITIAFMILVNNNGSDLYAYWPLKHADWSGFTPTDLIFPTFLFLMGIALVFSKRVVLKHVFRRTTILFLLGLLVNSFPLFELTKIRWYGVLQRIAIAYFISTLFVLYSKKWQTKAAFIVSSLLGYYLIMRYIPVPGYGVPTVNMPILDPDRNIVAWLDRLVFSADHLYEKTRDPEGIISTLPSLATALLGVLTGQWIKNTRPLYEKIKSIAGMGLVLIILGIAWNLWFPINKKLWTSSYVLFAGGLSMSLLALCMWAVDHRKTEGKFLAPFFIFGTNAIAAYVFSELLSGGLQHIWVKPNLSFSQASYEAIVFLIPNPAFASLLYSLIFVGVCFVPIYVLYRKQIFIKI